ncbi:21761_t:CDS:1, partial [Dentiscutata erythropus]
SNVSVVATRDPNQEFNSVDIPISISQYMLPVLVKSESQNLREITYFDTEYSQYNTFTSFKNILMKIRVLYPTNSKWFTYLHTNNSIKPGRTFLISGFFRYISSDMTIMKTTDIDFFIISNAMMTIELENKIFLSSSNSNNRLDIDLIIDKIESNTSSL